MKQQPAKWSGKELGAISRSGQRAGIAISVRQARSQCKCLSCLCLVIHLATHWPTFTQCSGCLWMFISLSFKSLVKALFNVDSCDINFKPFYLDGGVKVWECQTCFLVETGITFEIYFVYDEDGVLWGESLSTEGRPSQTKNTTSRLRMVWRA